MNDYILMTDSSCDLSFDMLKKISVECMPLTYHLEGKEYKNSPDGPSFTEIYRKLRDGALITTSAASTGDCQDIMEKHLEEGKDILYIAFSSALSGTHNSGRLAAEELSKKYPDRKIYVVDSLCASMGQGLLVWLCANKKKAGASIDELCDYAEKTKGKICHWFTVEDLHFLKRGGRVSATAAVIGSMLHVKPVLHVDDGGYLKPVSKARGRMSSIKALVDNICSTITDPAEQTVFISHGDCVEDANKAAEMLRNKITVKDILINFIGPVIGAHSGPGTLAIFCVGSKR